MKNKPNICLVAIDIRSSYNVGSMFRSCDGFSSELFLVGITPSPKQPEDSRLPHVIQKASNSISKTALGAENSVRWRYANRFVECQKLLKDEGYKILAIEQSGDSKNIKSMNYSGKVALVVGREVEGLTEEELDLCDDIYEIPMSGKKESFNVSVVAGIALFQASGVSI